jgi:eukaryotic-like serine/threonine-protein kinase
MTDVRDSFQASLGDAYTFERELGGGGMSRVFVAEEKALARRVVVKVLPAELAGGVSIARFQREISLAARLQHPHIVPVLTAGEIQGLPYYTMPFVDGESLRARLSHGSLPIGEAISILRDVAKALDFAHSKGVAHRDIKPDNVLLAGTSAVITDFGVAKAISDAATGGTLTSAGIALGTAAYMAPEQAAADPATDLRADFYAFGVMAYEILAGHLPFAGRSAQAMLAAHATEAPPSIASLRPATPPALADLVMRCMQKTPADRPQSAAEILSALDAVNPTSGNAVTQGPISSALPGTSRPRARSVRVSAVAAGVVLLTVAAGLWWRGRSIGVTTGGIRSIAVLPFQNTSRDSTLDYLEDGITDHVRDALNAIPELAVKARGSSRQLKGRNAREVGTTLGVVAVLQGTVSRAGDRLHLTTELVRTSDDNVIWSGTFDGRPSELAGMQDTISRAVTDRLRLGRVGEPARGPGARGTTDPDAYLLFLQGRFAYDHLDEALAAPFFERALAKDPRFALAEAYLAMTHAMLPVLGFGSLDSALALARAEADKALALDSTVVEAYIAQADIVGAGMRLDAMLAPFERALAIDSTNADVLWRYGLGLAQVGRLQEALVQLERARRRDPLSAGANGVTASVLMMLGRYDEAIAAGKAALAVDPSNVLAVRHQGSIYLFSGKPDSALAYFERAFRLQPTTFGNRAALIVGYAAAGRWTDAERERAVLLKENRGNSPNFERTLASLAFSQFDDAMTYLERAVANREAELGPLSLPCDPLFDPLKSNPRFVVVMERIGARACPSRTQWPIAPPPRE